MARINLMPWREKRRKERQRAFASLVGFAALAAVAVLALGWLFRAGQIEVQESRNDQLTKEIDLMKKKVEEIQDLDIKRERLLGRKQVIEELQSNRSHMVHLFDQLVRTVPEGIMLSSVNQRGTALTIEGRSESNSRVSEYLRRLDASGWLDKPDLQIIEEEGSGARARSGSTSGSDSLPYLFKIQVTLVNPNQPNEDGEVVEQSAPTQSMEEVEGASADAVAAPEEGSTAPAAEAAVEGGEVAPATIPQAIEVPVLPEAMGSEPESAPATPAAPPAAPAPQPSVPPASPTPAATPTPSPASAPSAPTES